MAIDPQLLFDPNLYRDVNPDLAGLSDDRALQHLLDFGLNEGRRFSSFVDLDFYADANPDLAAAGLTTRRQLFDHLSTFGVEEGRRYSILFDANFYATANPDLTAAGIAQPGRLLEHFALSGINENRRPSVFFDPSSYELYDDLFEELDSRQLLQHFAFLGLNEGRIGSEDFDVLAYLRQNPDLGAAGFDNQQAAQHFAFFGSNENRLASDDTIETALDLGNLTEFSVREFISFSFDPVDFYRFTLPTDSTVTIRQNEGGEPQNIGGLLLFPQNVGGILLVEQPQNTSAPVSIFDLFDDAIFLGAADDRPADALQIDLEAGTYAIASTALLNRGFIGRDDMFYTLQLAATPLSSPIERPGNTPASAADLGTIGTQPFDVAGRLGELPDFYRFTLDNRGRLDLEFDNVTLELSQDADGNGTISEEERLVTGFFNSLGLPVTRFQRTLLPGEYLLQVSGSGFYEIDNISATLDVPDNNDTPATAQEIDPLTGTVLSDAVFFADAGLPADEDFYRFDVDGDRELAIVATQDFSVTGAPPESIGLAVELFRDDNNNLAADPGESLFQDADAGLPVRFTDTVPAGTYFIRVFGNINYTLDVQLV